MRITMAQPIVSDDEDVQKIRVQTASNVCASEAYTITVPSKENRYIPALSWGLTDEECDLLLEQLAAARAERLMAQEKTYEALHAKFGGEWNNLPASLHADGWTAEPTEEV
jgi:hypothetical protein